MKNSPSQYRNAYIYSEQDDNDLTYFIDYNIKKIKQAMVDFNEYLKRKHKENERLAKIARSSYNLNERQIQILKYFCKNKGASTSLKTYTLVNNISRVTAAKDLEILESMNFIISFKEGKFKKFYSTDKILEIFS